MHTHRSHLYDTIFRFQTCSRTLKMSLVLWFLLKMNKTLLHTIHKASNIYITNHSCKETILFICTKGCQQLVNLSKTIRLHLKTLSCLQADNSWCWWLWLIDWLNYNMNQKITIGIRSYDRQTTELYNSKHTDSTCNFVYFRKAKQDKSLHALISSWGTLAIFPE